MTADRKAELRTELARRLAALGPTEIARRSAQACGHLIDLRPRPKAVMAYLALPGEADPAAAIASWRAAGVPVAAPKVNWSNRTMQPALLGGELVTGRHGLREPPPDASLLELNEIGLVVVPGLGFSAGGARLGRGGGFYDRFLARLPAGTETVGLVLSCQLMDEIPTDAHDRAVDMVVTEDGPVV